MKDPSESFRFLKRDKRFATLIKKHGLPDMKRTGTPFRALVRAIIGQQVSGAAARSIFARFIVLFPKGKFPTPQAVRKMSIEKMRAAGLSRQKVSYIKDLAEKFSDGTIRHRHLHTMTSDEIIEHLVQVKGIGVWTVHMFLVFTLNRPDVLPTGDLGIRKGFQIVYGLKSLPDHARMERLALPWRAHASTASWYLWRAADSARPTRPPKPRRRREPNAKEGEAKRRK
ncbi:hypothetical protein A2851_01805 [Candidatus Kaiserbacteria bacterium RIFCSPHIGHO2_01_FULL_53_29]|uniref:DNA-3-methyladenine glycosylase II n=1 Tax=Candidatus Kaiserbacteria bacterium RIFCSPHIGHO2_01_FULL_53_29 TaxID=1798480 RepID=A0A1F6CWR6_9BACT|nr:MAG: hypothetical protein A2851_01805 [Candidatus Kaiserbacteria bacterium RIFCSPHIGHO2_01_FULL_53_29]